jgi:hypothetical protein
MRLLALLVVALISLSHTSIAAESAATFSVEVRRGFNAATYATRDSEHPDQWIANFEHALRIGERNHTNSDAFVLGAQFGLSYRIAEFERCNQQILSPGQLRALVIQGTRARLKYEECKHAPALRTRVWWAPYISQSSRSRRGRAVYPYQTMIRQ